MAKAMVKNGPGASPRTLIKLEAREVSRLCCIGKLAASRVRLERELAKINHELNLLVQTSGV